MTEIETITKGFALSPIEQAELEVLGNLTLTSPHHLSTQVPVLEVDIMPTGDITDRLVANLEDLFKKEYVYWVTSKSIIKTFECRNPKTKKLLSGFVFLSPTGFEKYKLPLYEIYRIKMRTPISRAEFFQFPLNAAEDYDAYVKRVQTDPILSYEEWQEALKKDIAENAKRKL